MTTTDFSPETFEEGRPRAVRDLVLELDGFEGPIDVLLTLARRQKVDLSRISILALAEQYLEFIAAARELRLEVAADHLVMAAWLAYLKSRLLLPEQDLPDEPSAPELAEALAYRLSRLDAMRKAGEELLRRPRLGQDVFPRGAPEGVEVRNKPVYQLTLFQLLKAYGDNRRMVAGARLTIEPSRLYSIADAMERLSRIAGFRGEWKTLSAFLPEGLLDGVMRRSAIASTFAASLQLVRTGTIQLRQTRPFGPLMIRGRKAANG